MCRDSELGCSLPVATYRSGKLVLRPDDDGTFNNPLPARSQRQWGLQWVATVGLTARRLQIRESHIR